MELYVKYRERRFTMDRVDLDLLKEVADMRMGNPILGAFNG